MFIIRNNSQDPEERNANSLSLIKLALSLLLAALRA